MDGFYAGGFAKALNAYQDRQLKSRALDITGMQAQTQREAKLREGVVTALKSATDNAKSLFDSTVQKATADAARAGVDPQQAVAAALSSPAFQRTMAGVVSPSMRTALMYDSQYGTNLGDQFRATLQTIMAQPSPVQAATVTGTATGTSKAAQAAAVSSNTDIPLSEAQQAAGIALTPSQKQPRLPSLSEITVPIIAKAHANGLASLTDNDWAALDLARQQSPMDMALNEQLRTLLAQKTQIDRIKKKFDADQSKPAGSVLGKQVSDGKYAGQYQVLDSNGNVIGYYQ